MSIESKASAAMESIVRAVKTLAVEKRVQKTTGKTVAEIPVLKGVLPRVAFVYSNDASLVHVLLLAGFALTGSCGESITMYQHKAMSDADVNALKDALEMIGELIYKKYDHDHPSDVGRRYRLFQLA